MTYICQPIFFCSSLKPEKKYVGLHLKKKQEFSSTDIENRKCIIHRKSSFYFRWFTETEVCDG